MTPLMSFWPSVYDKIEKRTKIIEYRRNFPKDCTYAYMYISKPVKAICAIIYFGRKYELLEWQQFYATDPNITKRINNYIQNYRYGIEIVSIQKIKPITLENLRKNIQGFSPPQSYILFENNKALEKYVKNNTVLIGDKIINNLSNIFPEHICKRY